MLKWRKNIILLKYVKMFGGFNFSFYLCNVKRKQVLTIISIILYGKFHL